MIKKIQRRRNCINLEWNWTNWERWLRIFDRFFLRFAWLLIASKWYFISSVNGYIMAHVPNMNITKLFTATSVTVTNTCIRQMAIRYPTIFFVSNGNLWKCEWNLVNRLIKRSNEIDYHMGKGNLKADFSKCVTKYVKKLTIVAGHVVKCVTLENTKSRSANLFSNFRLVSVYNTDRSEYVTPAFTQWAIFVFGLPN